MFHKEVVDSRGIAIYSVYKNYGKGGVCVDKWKLKRTSAKIEAQCPLSKYLESPPFGRFSLGTDSMDSISGMAESSRLPGPVDPGPVDPDV